MAASPPNLPSDQDASGRSFDTAELTLLADACGVEAVLVYTPPDWHADIRIALRERGGAVLREKPLRLDVASAARVIEAAYRSLRTAQWVPVEGGAA